MTLRHALKTVKPADRKVALERQRLKKMTSSVHAYVRGSTEQFYEWLSESQADSMPAGPPIWICGDCHIGNLGPIANLQGDVAVQIRDLDQTVIGNPAHDVIRLALSLAMAARSSDLPGVTTAVVVEQLIEGYMEAFVQTSHTGAASKSGYTAGQALPQAVRGFMKSALKRSWRQLASERLEGTQPTLPMGRRFWKLTSQEDVAIRQLFEKDAVTRLATALASRDDEERVSLLDAAYWLKGCSSLGRLRYAAVLGIGLKNAPRRQYCLMDLKEAVAAAAPAYRGSDMPADHAARVVEGARNLSPHLGERMAAAKLFDNSIMLRELMPQDLKMEFTRLSHDEAAQVSRYLAGVVGKAHARQMDGNTARRWHRELKKYRSKTMEAPSWLWKSVVELVARHEAGYLQYCRLHAREREA
jgi:uncharacterized protein (DUF2252 family)